MADMDYIKKMETQLAVLNERTEQIYKTLERLVTVAEKQSVLENKLSVLEQDLGIAFKNIRKVNDSGTSLCGSHILRTTNIEKRLDTIEGRAWQIWLLIIGQILTAIFLLLRS
jgi:septation ring formation regulator EzrA